MKIAALTAFAAFVILSAPAQAARYELVQTGWPVSGTLYGKMIADDLDGNGVIDSFLGEVSWIELRATGGWPFNDPLTESDLHALRFDLDGSDILGDSDFEGLGFNADGFWLFVGPLAFVGPCNGVSVCGEIWTDWNGVRGELVEGTSGPMIVSAVPLPSALPCLLAASALLWSRARTLNARG